MNAKRLLVTAAFVVAIFCGGLCTGLKLCSSWTAGLETDVSELVKRNKLISSRLLTLEEESRRHAEESRLLAAGIGDISKGLADSVNRARSIEDRAERINYLAGVLDKGISELIRTAKDIQDSSASSSRPGGS